jgi:LCP family protein required for cell wall assembly
VLKKIVIVVALLLAAAVGVAGFEIFQLQNGFGKVHVPVAADCPILTVTPTATASATRAIPHGRRAASHDLKKTATPTSTPGVSSRAVNPFLKRKCVPDPKSLPTLSGTHRINILVLGSDNDNKFVDYTNNGNRTKNLLNQTVMVVTVDPVHKTVAMLSIPRDSWVYIPGVSTAGDPSTYHKMDEAMSYGMQGSSSNNIWDRFKAGVRLARATVEQNFGIRIDYYAWVGLTGFTKVIDTLQGIVIDGQHPILDDSYPADLVNGHLIANSTLETRVYIPAGPQYMDSATALEYARSRHADLVGDFGRGARQMQMLLGIRRKAQYLNVTSVGTIQTLLGDLSNSFRTDIDESEAFHMYDFSKTLNVDDIHRVVLSPPQYSSIGSFGAESIVLPNWPAIRPVIKKMFRPVNTIKSKPSRPSKQKKISVAEAMAAIGHVSGVLPNNAEPSQSQARSKLHGRIFFVRSGNIWSFTGKKFFQITHSHGISDPTLTPNGNKLVFSRRWSDQVSDLYLRNRQRHVKKQLTHDFTNDGITGDQVWAYNPDLTPDGKTIIYASDAYKLTNPTGFIDLALYRYDLATGVSSQLTYPAYGAGGDVDPAVDPADPNLVVYSHFFYRPDQSLGCQLRLLDLTTDESTGLTPVVDQVIQPTWQPNGRHLAYIVGVDQEDSTELNIAPFRNGRLLWKHAKTLDTGMVAEPAFSPDGRHIAYDKLVGKSFEMWELDLRHGNIDGTPYALFSVPGMDAVSRTVWLGPKK